MVNPDGFRHLDPTTVETFQHTVLYGFELIDMCLIVKVKNGWVVETPVIQGFKWIRGQHIETLGQFFSNIKPLRIV